MTSEEKAGNQQELQQEIERTREQLGHTVQALAAKTDLKAQAREAVGHVTGRLKSTAVQARQQAAATADKLSKATPEPVQGAAAKAAATARQRRLQLVMTASAIVFAGLAIALWRRR